MFSADSLEMNTTRPQFFARIAGRKCRDRRIPLITLTSTQAHFYRVDTFASANEYAVNYYSIFKNQMLNLLSGVIRNDPTTYGGYVSTSGASPGVYQPTPVVDFTTFGQVKPALPDYMQPGVRRVDTPVNKTIRVFRLRQVRANYFGGNCLHARRPFRFARQRYDGCLTKTPFL